MKKTKIQTDLILDGTSEESHTRHAMIRGSSLCRCIRFVRTVSSLRVAPATPLAPGRSTTLNNIKRHNHQPYNQCGHHCTVGSSRRVYPNRTAPGSLNAASLSLANGRPGAGRSSSRTHARQARTPSKMAPSCLLSRRTLRGYEAFTVRCRLPSPSSSHHRSMLPFRLPTRVVSFRLPHLASSYLLQHAAQ